MTLWNKSNRTWLVKLQALGHGGLERGNLLWVISLSIICAVSLNIVFWHVSSGIFHTLPGWHLDHIKNQAPAPLQFRWISYGLPEVFIAKGFDVTKTYLSFRTIYLAIAIYYLGLITQKITNDSKAATTIILGFSLFYATSTQAHFQFSEEPNLMVFSVFLWLVLANANIFFVILIFIFGALNKDTVGFLIPFYFLYSLHHRSKLYSIITTAILSIIFLTIYAYLREHFGVDRPYLGGLWQYNENVRYFLSSPAKGFMWAIASILPIAYFMLHWQQVPLAVRCFIPSTILFLIGHILISRIAEFRTYSPLIFLLWPGVYVIAYRTFKT